REQLMRVGVELGQSQVHPAPARGPVSALRENVPRVVPEPSSAERCVALVLRRYLTDVVQLAALMPRAFRDDKPAFVRAPARTAVVFYHRAEVPQMPLAIVDGVGGAKQVVLVISWHRGSTPCRVASGRVRSARGCRNDIRPGVYKVSEFRRFACARPHLARPLPPSP